MFPEVEVIRIERKGGRGEGEGGRGGRGRRGGGGGGARGAGGGAHVRTCVRACVRALRRLTCPLLPNVNRSLCHLAGPVRNLEAARALLIMAGRQVPKTKMRVLFVQVLLENGSGSERARQHCGVAKSDGGLVSTSSERGQGST
jgi:hypothetical protein